MKVIKEPEKFKPMRLTCKHCKAELEAESPNDFQRSVGGDYRDSWDHAITDCPCCGSQIQVPRDRFQSHIYEALKRA